MPDHTIAENLARLQAARTNISAAITTKGGTVPSGAGFEDFPTAIASIPEATSEDADLFGVPATAQNPKLFTDTFTTTGTTTALAKMAEYWPFDEVTQDGKYYWGEDNYFSNDANDAYMYAYNGSTYLNYFDSMSGESDKTVVIGENFFLGIFSRVAIFCGYAEDEDGLTKKCIGLIPFTDHSDPVCFAFDDGERIFYKNQYYGTYGSSNAFNQYTKILYGATKYTIKDLQIMLAWQYRPTDPGAECTIGDDQAYLYSSIAALAKTLTAHAAPPLEFESDGSNLKNWTIFGNDPGVGERTKNLCEILIPNGYERSGVVATVDKNAGTIVINGDTNSQSSGFSIPLDASQKPITGISGNYTLTGCPDGGSTTTFDLYMYDVTTSTIISPRVYSSTGSLTFTADPLHEYRVYIQLRKENIYNNVRFRPMLRSADTTSDFEPYGYKIPVETRERGKNLFPVGTAPDFISDDVTLSVNNLESGTIEASADGSSGGTHNAYKQIIYTEEPTIFKDGVSYTISATVDSITGDLSTFAMIAVGNGSNILYSLTTRSVGEKSRTFTFDSSLFSTGVRLYIYLTNEETQAGTIKLSNIMIRESSTSSAFEPYWKVADTTPIYTQTQLGTGDTLTKEQTGVDIPTVDGENYITVATTTQPAAMTIAYTEPEPEE